MKKVITKILIITLLFTFIMPRFIYATSEDQYNALADKGQASVNGNMVNLIDTPTSGDAVVSILAMLSSGIAEVVRGILSAFVNEENLANANNFTIGELISGDYEILNNDFFTPSNGSDLNNKINNQVRIWYYTIRNLAIVLSLFMLLYIGIRMALSTVAEDKAKYKKMFMGWIQSFVLIFALHYIMIIVFYLQKALMNIFNTVISIDGQAERDIVAKCWFGIILENGWNILWYAILYWVMVYYQVKFFFLYAKRMIATAFLIVIAPLITVTYSIDKIGDNRAQAYKSWFKEFLVNVFIQPVHFIVYGIFIVSASEIATAVPLFTLIFFGALSRGEKVIKGVFGMRGMKSINSVGRGKRKKS